MSALLGSQNCIESLRKDLIDLQGATVDVFSKTGPVCFSSWKFPDKLSWSLDMVALLQQYDFVHGEDEFNRHSHVVLLELVIDRLLLLLQSFDSFVEQVRCNQGGQQKQQRGPLSVGLVVRSYWSHLVQFTNLTAKSEDIEKQTKTTAPDCDGKDTVSSLSQQTTPRSAGLSSKSSAEFPSQNHLPSGVTPSLQVERNSVGCQTSETSPVPCDACHQTQSVLRRTGDALVGLFQSEGLPSSLQPLLAAVEGTVELGHMTAADVAQWANEELQDMQRLGNHLQDTRAAVQPLRDRIVEAEAEIQRFRTQLTQTQSHFKQELEKHQANIVQLEFSLNKAQRSVKETEARLQEEQRNHRREIQSLEGTNSRLKDKMAAQEDALQTLYHENNALQEKMKMLHKKEETCCKLEQTIKELEAQISQTRLLLDKEKAKYQSAWRQQESMQAKHQSLLKRVDVLYEECEELQGLLGEGEDKQADLLNQLKLAAEEKERVHARLSQQQGLCSELQKDKQTLQADIGQLRRSLAELKEYVQTLQERERRLASLNLNPLPAMKTGRQQSEQMSAGSEEPVSATAVVKPSYQTPQFQADNIRLDSMSLKSHIKLRNTSVFRRK